MSQQRRSPFILVVEDDPSIRSLMELVLSKQDHWKLSFAGNGKKAVELYKENNFDLIIMDIRLPNMDGIEATKKIREQEKKTGRERTPVIVFTADTRKESHMDCHDADIDDLIVKPSKMEKVVNSVKNVLPDAVI